MPSHIPWCAQALRQSADIDTRYEFGCEQLHPSQLLFWPTQMSKSVVESSIITLLVKLTLPPPLTRIAPEVEASITFP